MADSVNTMKKTMRDLVEKMSLYTKEQHSTPTYKKLQRELDTLSGKVAAKESAPPPPPRRPTVPQIPAVKLKPPEPVPEQKSVPVVKKEKNPFEVKVEKAKAAFLKFRGKDGAELRKGMSPKEIVQKKKALEAAWGKARDLLEASKTNTVQGRKAEAKLAQEKREDIAKEAGPDVSPETAAAKQARKQKDLDAKNIAKRNATDFGEVGGPDSKSSFGQKKRPVKAPEKLPKPTKTGSAATNFSLFFIFAIFESKSKKR